MKVLVLGANGQIGRLVVEESKKAGYHTTALARRQGSLADSPADEVVYGQLTDQVLMHNLIADADVVLSSVGVKMIRKRNDQSMPTADGLNVILEILERFPEKRLVLIGTPTLADKEHDNRNKTTIFPSLMARIFMPAAYREMKEMQKILEGSQSNWTVVRFINPNLKTDGGGIGYVLGEKTGKFSISRRNIARFMVEKAIEANFRHQMPIVFNQ